MKSANLTGLFVSSSYISGHIIEANAVQVVRTLESLSVSGRFSFDVICARAFLKPKILKVAQPIKNIRYLEFVCPRIRWVGVAIFSLSIIGKFLLVRREYDFFYGRTLWPLFLLGALYPRTVKIYEAHMPPAHFEKLVLSLMVDYFNLKCIFAVSKRLTESYLKACKCDVELLRNTAFDSAKARQLPVLVEKRLVYLGSISRRKGSEMLLDLARELPDFRFEIIGRLVEPLQNIPENVVVMDPLPSREIEEFIRSSSCIFLAPYQNAVHGEMDDTAWGAPLKIFEFMSCGVRFVASDLGIIREIVGDEPKVLCAAGAVSEWKSSIEWIFDNPDDNLWESLRWRYEQFFAPEKRAGIQTSRIRQYF